jgi:hypothetical protein
MDAQRGRQIMTTTDIVVTSRTQAALVAGRCGAAM